MLKITNHIGKSYLIVGGVEKNQGIVIEKGRYKVDHERVLDVDNGIWYLV